MWILRKIIQTINFIFGEEEYDCETNCRMDCKWCPYDYEVIKCREKNENSN